MHTAHKRTWLIAIGIAVICLGIYLFLENPGHSVAPTPTDITTSAATTFDPTNATYSIEGRSIALINGKSEIPTGPGSTTKTITSIFGEPASGDLNGDGKPDAAIIIVQDNGGSGTFYYAAAAINVPGGTEGTNAIILGDRIAPQNISIKNGQVIVNYADRKPGQPFTTQPSVGITKYLSYIGSTLQSSAPIAGPGEACGGNIIEAPVCESGYHCAPKPGSHLPFGDVGGVCMVN